MSSGALIHAHGVSFGEGRRPILDRVELEIFPREIVTLIGPNGAGKTTLARLLLGILKPAGGHIHHSPGLKIGYVPQRLTPDPFLPLAVRRFLELAGEGIGRPRIVEALHEVEAVNLIDQPLHALSGGELQRVLLARALLREPELLILDEPLRGVDVGGQALFYERLTQIRDRFGCGILLISHDLYLVMASTDRVVCINRHVCCSGRPEDISRDPAFAELFGKRSAAVLALYSHHHDHAHGWHGEEEHDG